MKLCFLLAKDPTSEQVGDTAMINRLLELAGVDHELTVICWSARPDLGSSPGIVRLAKPPVSPGRVAVRAMRHGRSLLHARFDDPAMRAAIEASDADAFVAVHFYLAEPFLRSARRSAPLHAGSVPAELV